MTSVFIQDSAVSFGKFFTSSISITNMTMQSIASEDRWLYLSNSSLTLISVSLSDTTLSADPGFMKLTRSTLAWKGGVLRSVWTTGQMMIDSDNSAVALEDLDVARYNATFLASRRGTVDIAHCKFADGGLYRRKASKVTKVNGGLLSCTDCLSVTVRDLTAQRLSAASGGALYLVFQSLGAVSVSDSSFEDCAAGEMGGALLLRQAALRVAGNWFQGNRAEAGGALCLSCEPMRVNCSSFVEGSVFVQNTAIKGGAVHWHENRPTFMNNTYTNNSAVYGPNEASAASHLGLIDAHTLQPISHLDYEGIPGQRVPIPLLIGLIDHVGQLVATDNSSYINIRDNPSATFLGPTRLIAVNGVANYSAFIIKGKPGSVLTVEAFSEEIPMAQTNYERHPGFSFEYPLRNCIPGEDAEGDTCYTCPKTSYSLSPSQNCTACPSLAVCPGGATLVLDPGYWRSSSSSNHIFPCFTKEACKGGVNATCGEGFESNLCGMCAPGYYRVGKYSCFECGSDGALFTRIGLLGALCLVLLGLMVLFGLSRADSVKESAALDFSTLVKILISFTQTMMLISGIKTEWNDSVLRMFEVMEFFGSIVLGSFAPECYLHHLSSTPVVYLKLVIVSVGVVSAVVLLEAARLLAHAYRPSAAGAITALEVMALFLLQPTQLKNAMSLLDCKSLDTGSWLTAHMAEKCWEGRHKLYLLALALPTLIVFGAGVLVALAFVLLSARLQHSPVTWLFSVPFKRKFRYWELVSQSLKLCLAVSIASLGETSTKVQVLVATIILFASLYLHIVHQPYASRRMNRISVYSLVSVFMYLILAFYAHYFVKFAPTLKDVLSYLSFMLLFAFTAMWTVEVARTTRSMCKSTGLVSTELSSAGVLPPSNSVNSQSSIALSHLEISVE